MTIISMGAYPCPLCASYILFAVQFSVGSFRAAGAESNDE